MCEKNLQLSAPQVQASLAPVTFNRITACQINAQHNCKSALMSTLTNIHNVCSNSVFITESILSGPLIS